MSEKPNLLFVFSDQQSWDMLGCYGNDQIVTPNIDRLADDGVRFNHCISSSPVCTPQRGMLLSGQHPLCNGAMINDVQMLPGNGNYFAEVLRDAGYHTGYIGKWHLYGGIRERGIPPGPLRYGFDGEFFSNNCDLNYGCDDAFYWGENGERVKLGKWEPDGQTDQALEFIDRYAGEQPFALFVSWHPPHDWAGGYPVPAELEKLYDPQKISLRPSCEDSPKRRKDYRGYMAMCANLDDNFGRLMKKLDEKGIQNDTLVVYTSDHGDLLGSHGIDDWKKSRPEHVSCRVPLILRWPGILSPRVSDTVVGSLDLMPTLLGVLGIQPPDTCQGRNDADALREGRDVAGQSVPLFFWGEDSDWRGVYTERYTYSFEPPGATRGINVLYDRQEDPHELNNLFDAPEYRTEKEELHTLTLQWMTRFKDDHVPWDTVKRYILYRPRCRRGEMGALPRRVRGAEGATCRPDTHRRTATMTPRNESELQFDTRSIHAGRHPEYSSPPIYLSATGARGYTRGGNQTISAMEQAVSALEGGKHAVACACGMAAVTQTLLALLKAGDHVVCHRSVYDWTDWWLRDALGGIAVANDKAIHQKVCRSRSLQGGVISPFNAFLIMRGMETLSMRMDQHCANAVKVARFLAGHPAVGEVRYPGLPDDSGYELACEILPDGCGGLVGFTIRGGQAALDRFKAALKLVRPWVSLGDTGSLVYGRHPEPRKGIPEGFARLSVGLEAVEDITADLKQALDKAYRAIQ